jgi:RNA polymerase sigma factor (TIGR02999 family)
MGPYTKPITELLVEWRKGSAAARDRLFGIVYDELKRLARRQIWQENAHPTLQPTVLVHELYLRLLEQRTLECSDRTHFFGIAARLLRQILVDHVRSAGAAKRGGTCIRIPLEEAMSRASERDIDLVRLDDALLKLSQHDARQCEIVEMRFFGGLSVEETAEVIGISPATVKRDWAVARAWLYREMMENADERR